jgi:hypothetical protein
MKQVKLARLHYCISAQGWGSTAENIQTNKIFLLQPVEKVSFQFRDSLIPL